MKKAIIIGASSGIGKEMAMQLLSLGYEIGIAARRIDLLDEIKATNPDKVTTMKMDLLEINQVSNAFTTLIKTMGDVDLIVLNSGTGSKNPDLDFGSASRIIGVNVTGFTALANLAYNCMEKQGYETLVGVSSIAGIRGIYL